MNSSQRQVDKDLQRGREPASRRARCRRRFASRWRAALGVRRLRRRGRARGAADQSEREQGEKSFASPRSGASCRGASSRKADDSSGRADSLAAAFIGAAGRGETLERPLYERLETGSSSLATSVGAGPPLMTSNDGGLFSMKGRTVRGFQIAFVCTALAACRPGGKERLQLAEVRGSSAGKNR